jgi:hypothetical protein
VKLSFCAGSPEASSQPAEIGSISTTGSGHRAVNPWAATPAGAAAGDERPWQEWASPRQIRAEQSQIACQGLLVPATSRPPEQWSPADKLATVIQTAGLSGIKLGRGHP